MRFNSAQLIIISIIGFTASLVLHALTILNMYHAGNPEIILLTAGMIIVLLQESRELKDLERNTERPGLVRLIMNQMPHWMKYALILLGFYAFFNFAFAITPDASGGYVSLHVPPYKIRILSGFWIMFYGLSVCVAYAIQKETGAKQKEDMAD